MAKQSIYTESGFQALKDQLEYLKTVKRQELAKAVGEARSFGDLSENSEYDDAKREQAKLEDQIVELEETLSHAIVVKDHEIKTDVVSVGVAVTVKYLDDDEEVYYELVGTGEVNISENKISDQSPVGKAIVGAGVGDVVNVDTPSGMIKVEIVKIEIPRK